MSDTKNWPDRRITPWREDLAAVHLQGVVEVKHYNEPARHQVVLPVVPLHRRPAAASGLETQLLFGRLFDVYDVANGWAWGQEVIENGPWVGKGYVGYVPKMALSLPVFVPTHRVSAMRAPVFAKPDLKSAIRNSLPLGAKIPLEEAEEDYYGFLDQGFVHKNHVTEVGITGGDFVSVAEQHIGLPYVWGGISPDGVDCSGLVQTSLRATGRDAPRDADMQERELGKTVCDGAALQRGDLVFWKGHVGIMRDGETLLHANAYHMKVASEPLSEAIDRIERKGGPVRAFKRL
ncbi:MAG TPA: NlpC/P60 family protein [Hellea balneolensis]|uniref:NlpC/P60 family protein n=1 Tax=Hellea balneolensis TaxID=287478 RepID=A0A7V5NXE5_9PROT|nr:NlpC/P60 family protein [Hellea balneolensis]